MTEFAASAYVKQNIIMPTIPRFVYFISVIMTSFKHIEIILR